MNNLISNLTDVIFARFNNNAVTDASSLNYNFEMIRELWLYLLRGLDIKYIAPIIKTFDEESSIIPIIKLSIDNKTLKVNEQGQLESTQVDYQGQWTAGEVSSFQTKYFEIDNKQFGFTPDFIKVWDILIDIATNFDERVNKLITLHQFQYSNPNT